MKTAVSTARAKALASPASIPRGARKTGVKKKTGAEKMGAGMKPGAGTGTGNASHRRDARPAREHIAANDDAPSIGGLIFALQQRPSHEPFFAAAIASGVWLVIGGLLGWALIGAELTRLADDPWRIFATPAVMTVASTVLIPIALFWFLALLVWRVQELRLMSSAMTEVAVRLAEPDRMAEQSIASLGQTVRRQVAAMNDAISRALGRAGELEALVHNEVAALERSYSDNELGIRNLIDELASEREALANNSERVSEVLHGIGAKVSRDISVAGDQATRALAQATQSLAKSVDVSGRRLTSTIKESSDQTADMLSERGNTLLTSLGAMNRRIGVEVPALLERLGAEQTRLTKVIEGAGRNLTALETALVKRTGSLEGALSERTQHLQRVLQGYMLAVESNMTQHTKALDHSMAERTKTLNATLSQCSGVLDKTLGQKIRAFDAAFSATASVLDKGLSEKMRAFDAAFSATASVLDKGLSEKVRVFDAAFSATASVLDKGLSEKMQAFDATFSNKARALDASLVRTSSKIETALAARSEALDAALVERTRAIDQAFAGRLVTLDRTIMEGTAAIDRAVGEKAEALREAMKTHARAFSETLSRQSADLDETLMQGINAVQRTSENITTQSVRTIEGMASQAQILKEVSEGLLGQIHSLTGRFENQGQSIIKAAHMLESSQFKIDSVLEARHGEISALLERLSERAQDFDTLMQGYSDKLDASLSEAETRAKAVTIELSQGTEATGRAAAEQIDAIKSRTHEEAERALAELRNRFSDVDREVRNQLATLSSRFTETTEDVRGYAKKAAGELEATQNRLREQIEHLPAATKSSAEAMRSALSEQISALEQLTTFVDRQAAARDVTQPTDIAAYAPLSVQSDASVPSATRPPAQPPATPLAASSSGGSLTGAYRSGVREDGREAAPAQSPARPHESVPAAHTPPPDYTRAPSARPSDEPGRSLDHVAESLVGEIAAAGTGLPAGTDTAGAQTHRESSWSLGDLLARASREEGEAAGGSGQAEAHATGQAQGQERAQGQEGGLGGQGRSAPAAAETHSSVQRSTALVGALNIDSIARALDARTAAEVWFRYRSGERGIFSRHLYNSQGQVTFDEISRRYQGDVDFRSTVNRYLMDFERLLREADQRDPAGGVIQNYLVSETGRVYLLLAHASGRMA